MKISVQTGPITKAFTESIETSVIDVIERAGYAFLRRSGSSQSGPGFLEHAIEFSIEADVEGGDDIDLVGALRIHYTTGPSVKWVSVEGDEGFDTLLTPILMNAFPHYEFL